MIRLERMMEWRREDHGKAGPTWVDHLGQYRNEATVDDILSWLLAKGYVMVECAYNANVKKYVSSFSGTKISFVAQGETLFAALTNVVTAMYDGTEGMS